VQLFAAIHVNEIAVIFRAAPAFFALQKSWTIGRSVSSGCIRMINQDVIDLYERTPVGARVVVLPSR
jgi:hypothetical protein